MICTDLFPLYDVEFYDIPDDGRTYWRSARGLIDVRDMDTEHINNTIKCLKGEGMTGFPDPYAEKTIAKWLRIFKHELNRRD